MAPHSSTLAWKILWTAEPGGLQFMGSLRVRYDWATSLSLFTFMHWRRKWQPTPVFMPGESRGQGSLVCCRPWGRTESDTTEATWQQQQLAVASARGEAVPRRDCPASQERLNVSAVPTAPQVFFQPISLHLAYPGFSKHTLDHFSMCVSVKLLQSTWNFLSSWVTGFTVFLYMDE